MGPSISAGHTLLVDVPESPPVSPPVVSVPSVAAFVVVPVVSVVVSMPCSSFSVTVPSFSVEEVSQPAANAAANSATPPSFIHVSILAIANSPTLTTSLSPVDTS